VSSSTSASVVQTSDDVRDMECVKDSDLPKLSKKDLFSQCLLRGELQRASEKHEIELGNTLNSRDKEIETLKGEKKKLLEEIDDLSKENAKLKSKRLTIDPKTSLEIKLQHFKIWEIIAPGYEGAVSVAESLHQGSNLPVGKIFALKVLFNVFGHSTFTKVRSFYQTEYQALCAMPPHPNIVQFYGFFYDRINAKSLLDLPPEVAENDQMLSLFLVMEYIPRMLEQEAAALRKEGKLTAKQVMEWSLDIFTAIQHLLDNQFVHRDLKLNNVLVTDKGMLKICDFGCSIQLSDNMNMLYSPGSSLGGNPAHIPPELLNAQAGNMVECGSQDLWASGVMVYEMACGVSPFCDLDQRGYRMSDLPDLRIKNEKGCKVDVVFPVEFSEMVKLILEFEPSNRPQVQEVIAVTRKLVETD
jgi:serine/threonine protein kinase